MTALNSRLDGLQLSLPSEAQWEYACRAGTETARYSEDLDAIAWYRENSGNETHSVASKKANSWGLYDMLGNVWEWCADVWVNDYTEKARTSAAESASAPRVVRGGSWGNERSTCAQHTGIRYEPSYRHNTLGFRCAEFRARIDEQRERGERGRRCGAPRSPRPGERSAALVNEIRLRCPGQTMQSKGRYRRITSKLQLHSHLQFPFALVSRATLGPFRETNRAERQRSLTRFDAV